MHVPRELIDCSVKHGENKREQMGKKQLAYPWEQTAVWHATTLPTATAAHFIHQYEPKNATSTNPGLSVAYMLSAVILTERMYPVGVMVIVTGSLEGGRETSCSVPSLNANCSSRNHSQLHVRC